MQSNTDNGLHLNQAQGQILIKLARQVLRERLGKPVSKSEKDPLNKELANPCFQISCGTFVTLKINGQLRGCIGNLTSTEPLAASVRRNAIHAAFQDPRFKPLTAQELDKVEIEVSILTEPRSLKYNNFEELLEKLRPHIDGVIIRKKNASATFLPQVWEQLPEPREFLTHLCLKAGLTSDAWHKTELEVSTYQVQYFEEHVSRS